ncbi:MAG: hypothetical protein ACFE8N_11525 [Promethearchaeota archaeon]
MKILEATKENIPEIAELWKELTQQKIKELTGFSAGMISQGLNYLIKEDLIRKKKNQGCS